MVASHGYQWIAVLSSNSASGALSGSSAALREVKIILTPLLCLLQLKWPNLDFQNTRIHNQVLLTVSVTYPSYRHSNE